LNSRTTGEPDVPQHRQPSIVSQTREATADSPERRAILV
jgi:hypothetical protein